MFVDTSLLQRDGLWRKMLPHNFLYVLMQVGSFNKVCFLRYYQLCSIIYGSIIYTTHHSQRGKEDIT